jgi:hypothetical protein
LAYLVHRTPLVMVRPGKPASTGAGRSPAWLIRAVRRDDELVPVQGEAGSVPPGGLVLPDPQHRRDVDAEEQDQCSRDARVERHRVVAEAPFELAHPLGLVDEHGRLGRFTGRHGNVADQSPLDGPGHEGPDAMPAGRAGGQPARRGVA